MPKWKTHLVAMVALLSAITGLTVVGAVMASPASAADCNNTVYWHAGYNDRHDNAFIGDNNPQLNGPYAGCGQVNYAHAWTDIRLHCGGYNDNGVVWAHIRNINYNSGGWVRATRMVARVRAARIQIC